MREKPAAGVIVWSVTAIFPFPRYGLPCVWMLA
jgi:hypothetical protein